MEVLVIVLRLEKVRTPVLHQELCSKLKALSTAT
jgi:hypothetical protein